LEGQILIEEILSSIKKPAVAGRGAALSFPGIKGWAGENQLFTITATGDAGH